MYTNEQLYRTHKNLENKTLKNMASSYVVPHEG